jgi:hypothetical protein
VYDVVDPAGTVAGDWLLGVSARTHAFGIACVASIVLAAGTAKTNMESTPNKASKAVL